MKRTIWMLVCVVLLLTGCGEKKQPEGHAAEGETISFTDDLGRDVSLEKPKRVAALTGSFADLWCLAGGADTLVAAAGDSWTSFELELPETVANLGGIKEPDLERLLASEPDLVLLSSNTAAQVELLAVLDKAGLTTACFNVTNFDEYLNMLDICTRLTGDDRAYACWGAVLEAQIEAAKARVDGSAPTVLYIRATGASCKVKNSKDTVLGEMLADLGCVNIADREGSLLEQLSLEAVLQVDPDYIFAVAQGADDTAARRNLETTLLSNPAWQRLSAVREGRFYLLEHRLYNLKPNARWGEAYEKLADILYPRG